MDACEKQLEEKLEMLQRMLRRNIDHFLKKCMHEKLVISEMK